MKPSEPKILLHIEGLAVLLTACVAYHELGASWGKFAALFLVPDISMLGYLLGKKIGAHAYNLVHTYFAPFLLWAFGYFGNHPTLLPLCVIWIAHIGCDRFIGYGLKYSTDFKTTHFSRV